MKNKYYKNGFKKILKDLKRHESEVEIINIRKKFKTVTFIYNEKVYEILPSSDFPYSKHKASWNFIAYSICANKVNTITQICCPKDYWGFKSLLNIDDTSLKGINTKYLFAGSEDIKKAILKTENTYFLKLMLRDGCIAINYDDNVNIYKVISKDLSKIARLDLGQV